MLKISFLELIMRGIPEGLLFFLAVYAFSKNFIEVKKYLFSSILYSFMVYLIRFLPIQNGADYILNLSVLIVLTVFVNKFPIIRSIKIGIIIMLIEFICEGINVFFIQSIFKKNWNVIFKDDVLKLIYSSPSLLLFGCIVIVYYIVLWKRKELKCT